MGLLWIAIVLFVLWIIFWATFKVVGALFWLLLGLAIAALIAYFYDKARRKA